jgi:hypothetical protein
MELIHDNFSWTIPSTINLPLVLKRHKPTFRYRIDYFYHILDTICYLMEYVDLKEEDQWVHLNAKRLQTFNQKYNLYLKYLKDAGIIDINPRYKVGEESRGYRIRPEYYDGEPIEIPLRAGDLKVKGKVKRLFKEKTEAQKLYTDSHTHLTKWFNEKLTIDRIGAIQEVNRLWPKIEQVGPVRGELKPDKKNGRFKALRAIEKLANGEFYYKVDDNIGRFHSNLTNIKKELRKYIRYDGQILVNLDIKNSQPMLSCILLNPEFYKKGANLSIYGFPVVPSSVITTLCNTIMLSVCPESKACQEFQEYLRIAQGGIFYEEINEILFPGKPFDKHFIKPFVLTIFYIDNRHGGRQRKREKPFVEKFPNVYKVFTILKKNDNTRFSHILQRTESHIVIEKATRRIAKERPDLPIFTVHDSIATTVGNEEYVLKLLKDEIKALTGLNASIGREVWANDSAPKWAAIDTALTNVA